MEFGDCARTSRPFEIGPSPMPLAAVAGAADGPAIPRAALDYRPGEHNPLRAVAAELAECFDDGSYGALVVDLVHATSRATVATVHGGSERVRWCVDGVARTLTLDRDAQRCALAYGVMPLDEEPSLEVTKDDLRWGGESLLTYQDFLHDDGPVMRIDRVVEDVGNYLDAVSTRQLVVRGPIVVRATADAPLSFVNVVLNSLADFDSVLATKVGAGWRLVDGRTLPSVPVPLGSGGAVPDVAPGQPYLGVSDQGVRIGTTGQPGDELDGRDWRGVGEALRRLRGRAPGRTDIVVTARSGRRGTLTYADLIRALDAAHAAGFTDWRRELGDPPL